MPLDRAWVWSLVVLLDFCSHGLSQGRGSYENCLPVKIDCRIDTESCGEVEAEDCVFR